MEDNKKDVNDKPKPVIVRNSTDLQRLRLEKLMKNPDKPVLIPERPKERGVPTVPDFVRNVMGSSAGAGSGEFHVYRHLRRKEYARQKYMKEKAEREKLDDEHQAKLEENKRIAEEKTAKKRAKRQKKKQKTKNKPKKPKVQDSQESDDNSENSDSDPEENKVKQEDESIAAGENVKEGDSINVDENMKLEGEVMNTEENLKQRGAAINTEDSSSNEAMPCAEITSEVESVNTQNSNEQEAQEESTVTPASNNEANNSDQANDVS